MTHDSQSVCDMRSGIAMRVLAGHGAPAYAADATTQEMDRHEFQPSTLSRDDRSRR